MCCDVDCLDAATLAFTVGCQDPNNMQHQPQLPRFRRLAAAARQIIALVDDPVKVCLGKLCARVCVFIRFGNLTPKHTGCVCACVCARVRACVHPFEDLSPVCFGLSD